MRAILLMLTAVAIAFSECKADNHTDDLTLIETYFNAAVDAEGDEYFELREKVLQYGEAAVPFLKKASGNERVHERIIARALLAWLAQPDSEIIRSGSMKALNDALSGLDRKSRVAAFARLHIYDKIGSEITSVLECRGGYEGIILGAVPNRIKAMERHDVYLLEAAIKGFPPQWREQVGILSPPGYVNQLARCFAAALSGGCPCKDTPDVLIDLLNDDGSWLVRLGAAKGLEMIGDKAVVIPPLLQALKNDASQEVRLVTFLILRRITGDQLVAERIYKGNKIMSAHIEAAEKWWAENEDRLLEEQKQRQIGD